MFDSIGAWIAGFGPDQWMAAASAVIALLSFLFNWRVVSRQDKRNAANLRMAHDSDIIRWSDQVIATLAEAEELLREKGASIDEASFPARRSAARAQISALIDRGRLFFPNLHLGDKHGLEKEEGYQGHRQPALEILVAAHRLLGTAGTAHGADETAAKELSVIRRGFVAEVFKAIDPVRRGVRLKELSE